MKNVGLIIVLLFVLCSNKIFGQEEKVKRGLIIQIEAGPSLVTLKNNQRNIFNHRLSYFLGVNTSLSLGSIFSIKSGLYFEKKGTFDIVIFSSGLPRLNKYFINYNYLIIPAQFAFSLGKKIKYSLYSGGYFGFLLNQNINSKERKWPSQEYEGKKYDIGIQFGINISNFKHLERFETGIRISSGLTNINYSNNISLSTNSVSLVLGYKIGFK